MPFGSTRLTPEGGAGAMTRTKPEALLAASWSSSPRRRSIPFQREDVGEEPAPASEKALYTAYIY